MPRRTDVITRGGKKSQSIRKSQSAEAQHPAAKFRIYRNYFCSFSRALGDLQRSSTEQRKKLFSD